tara:strand:- start:3237 stop:3812 length:576 start_codon:yes stop_codon:yes gene_type:complete
MAASSPLTGLAQNEPSMFIPHVFANISYRRVRTALENADLGVIDRIDMPKGKSTNSNGQKYRQVYVHFKKWNTNEGATSVRQSLLSGDDVHLEYEEGKPWFWKVFKSDAPKPDYKPKTKKSAHKTKSKIVIHKKTPETETETETLRSELAMLRAQLAELKSSSPAYGPCTPVAPDDEDDVSDDEDDLSDDE